MVCWMEFAYDENVDILDTKRIAGSTCIGYTIPPALNKIGDLNLMLMSLVPNEVKVSFTIDDSRLTSNLTSNKTLNFNKRSSFYTTQAFTQSHSGPLGDIKGFDKKNCWHI